MMRLAGSELTLHKLEVLCAVADLDSVSLAAERLHIAQPVVSAHLRGLEAKLGVRIVQRHGRRIAFTEDGQRVLKWAREVLTLTRALDRELAQSRLGTRGKAIIAASMTVGSYLLPAALVRFRAGQPDVEIALNLATPRHVVAMIHSGEADMALTILDGSIDLGGLRTRVVGHEELVLAGRPEVIAAASALGPGSYGALSFVTAARGSTRRRLEDRLIAAMGVDAPRVLLELGHAEAMRGAIMAGDSVAFMFRSSIAPQMASGALAVLDLPGLDNRVPLHLLSKIGKQFSPFQQGLCDYLAAVMNCDTPNAP